MVITFFLNEPFNVKLVTAGQQAVCHGGTEQIHSNDRNLAVDALDTGRSIRT
jgi:hypothetical protein